LAYTLAIEIARSPIRGLTGANKIVDAISEHKPVTCTK